MTELKTQRTGQNVDAFLQAIPDEQKRRDCVTIRDLMREATGSEPVMWSGGIVGFGTYRYRYASGHSGDWLMTTTAVNRGAPRRAPAPAGCVRHPAR